MVSKKPIGYILLVYSLIAYLQLAYFTERSDFTQLIIWYSSLFIAYYFLLREEGYYRLYMAGAILFRISLLFSLPNLSDDVYRFIWDGRLSAAGYNPFSALPSVFLTRNIEGINNALYEQLNSKGYYTIYPSVCQFIFFIACKISPHSIPGSIIAIKLFILAFELGSILLLVKLLEKASLNKHLVFLYALNPLVIIELCGNIHLEAAMIFFILLSYYLLKKDQLLLSSMAFALAICSKLIPLILLPLLIRPLGLKKAILFGTTSCIFSIVLLLPYIHSPELLLNWLQSIRLYFSSFEFNGSLYYILRWIGIEWTGYNQIALLGRFMSGLVLLGIVYLSLQKYSLKNLPTYFLSALSIYLFSATTIHPWYICPLIAFSIFGNYRFAIIWSALIPLSYIAYQTGEYKENGWLIGLEYGVVFLFIIYELSRKKLRLSSTN